MDIIAQFFACFSQKLAPARKNSTDWSARSARFCNSVSTPLHHHDTDSLHGCKIGASSFQPTDNLSVAIGYLNLRRKKRIVKFFADIRSVPAQIVLLHISDASRTNNFHHLLPARAEDFFVCYHFLAKLKIPLFKYNYPPLFGLFINSDQWHHFSIS